MPNPLEILQRPRFENSPFADSNWAGRTAIASGDATADVACVQASSDSVFSLTTWSPTNAASGQVRFCDVKSINPGVGFQIGTQDGRGFAVPVVVHWTVLRTA